MSNTKKEWNLFLSKTYKDIMDFYLRRGTRGVMSRAAEALNCQRSYLSRIISGNMHLTPDQAFLLSKFLKFKPLEQSYFLTLLEIERSSNSEYKEHLLTKLREIQKQNSSLTERIQKPLPALNTTQETNYFSSWIWTAIHFLTSIPEFQSVEKISEKLSLNKQHVIFCLEKLKESNFVIQNGEKWIYKQGEFHIPKDSPLSVQHHQNWRARAQLDAQFNTQDNLHYTNIQTASVKDIAILKAMMLEFISRCKETLDPSEPQECVVMLCDLFTL